MVREQFPFFLHRTMAEVVETEGLEYMAAKLPHIMTRDEWMRLAWLRRQAIEPSKPDPLPAHG